MGLIYNIFKALFSWIFSLFELIKITFEVFSLGITIIKLAFIHIEKGIGYLLPFSTEMKDQKRKSNIVYLIFFILLKLAITTIAWYFVGVPFIDAYLQGYFSIFFHFIFVPISVLLGIGLLVNLMHHIRMKVLLGERSISMMSWFFDYWTRTIFKVLYFLFLITTLIMLYGVNKGNLNIEVIDVVTNYEHLTVLNLFIISISYLLINRLVGVKVHQYFYYYFNLHVDIDEYEKRLQQLSKHYRILHTEFDTYKYYYDVIHTDYSARKARKIVLRNKYIPISFTLHYYTNSNETEYHAVYQDNHALVHNLKSSKTRSSKNVFPRSPIIQKNYSEKIRKQLEEGPIKVKFPLKKLLIVSRVISIILMISLICFIYKINSWEAFLAVRSSVFWSIFWLMIICLSTYLFAWFYMNILITIIMIIFMYAIGFTEIPILFFLLIVLTVIANLIVLSFWRQSYIEKLLNLRFSG